MTSVAYLLIYLNFLRNMSSQSVNTIRIVEFLEKKNHGAIVIDIRTPEEIQHGKIAGALEMDCSQIDFQAQVEKLDRSKSYLLYCRSGYRSGEVLKLFQHLNFQDIHDLGGGIGEWIRTGNMLR